jgi:CubicO group peptidase (beta-lactamase class C family)
MMRLGGILFLYVLSGCVTDRGKDATSFHVDPGVSVEMDLPYALPEPDETYCKVTKSYAVKFYERHIDQDQFSGTFLVAKNGRILFERTSGYYSGEGKRKLTADDPMHVASITKVATAVEILRLCEKDLIDLDTEVRRYLKPFPYEKVTVRMLLNHRSGLPDYVRFSESIWDQKILMKNKDILHLLDKHKFPLLFSPGSSYKYSNTNFALLALIAEKVTGKYFPDLMKEDIFQPLGMDNTFIMDHKRDTNRVCQSYDTLSRRVSFNYLDATYGDKNMYTTARDLVKLDVALYSEHFLGDSLKRQMFRGYSSKKGKNVNYGLGVRIHDHLNKPPLYYHTGWWHGSTGCYAMFRYDTLCVIAIANKYTDSVYTVRDLQTHSGKNPFRFRLE